MTGCLPYVSLNWRDNTTPENPDFNDFYYSPKDGLAESIHHFIDANAIGQRFQNLNQPSFTIGETGFGTGLNFLITLKYWCQYAPKTSRLTYISTEAYPMASADLEKAHQQWPDLDLYAQKLRAALPAPYPGMHRISFEDFNADLILIFGPAEQTLKSVDAQIDAWFLDGFAPSRNPDMWSDDLFTEVTRLSHQNTTLSSFTAAGIVRRGLEAKGFSIQKRKAFGHKRDCITGHYEGSLDPSPSIYQRTPWFKPNQAPLSSSSAVTIIGAGIAGLTLGWHLKDLGQDVRLFDAGPKNQSLASGNPAGIMDPALANDDGANHEFHRKAWLYAQSFYRQLQAIYPEEALYNQSGLLRLAYKTSLEDRFEKLVNGRILDESELAWLTPKEASEIGQFPVPYPALWFKSAINPYPEKIVACLRDALAPLCQHRLIHLSRNDHQHWTMTFETEAGLCMHHTDKIVFANGHKAASLIADLCDLTLPIAPVGGQISYLNSGSLPSLPKTALSFGAYLTCTEKRQLILGASFDPLGPEDTLSITRDAHQKNLTDFHNTFPSLSIQDSSITGGRAAIRATTPDRMPIVGALPDPHFYQKHYHDLHFGRHISRYPDACYLPGLYSFCGFGSRGFQTSPLAAAFLAALIAERPRPLPVDQVIALHPARFLIRDAKRAGRA